MRSGSRSRANQRTSVAGRLYVLRTGLGVVDGIGLVNGDIGRRLVRRTSWTRTSKVEVGVPVRSRGDVQGAGQYAREAVMPLGRGRTCDDHPVYDLDAGSPSSGQ